jgi:hypothetical protein
LTAEQIGEALQECVSDEFIAALANSVPTLGEALAALEQTIASGELSDLEALVGSELIEFAQSKINGAEEPEKAKENIFAALQCLVDFISIDLNEEDLDEPVTEEQLIAAVEKCASDDFKALFGKTV